MLASLHPPKDRKDTLSAVVTILLLTTSAVHAEGPSSPAGRWKGALEMSGKAIEVKIELRRKEGGEWNGEISIPDQGAKDLPLSRVKVADGEVSFTLEGVPGDPGFEGKLSEEGQRLAGTFRQGGQALCLKLKREGSDVASLRATLDGFDPFVEQAIKDWEVPGLAIAVVKDGEVLYAKGFGKRDVKKDLPVTSKTIFAIGSCTKAFTTFALGTLVDEGKLDWDKPVRTYLPGFRMHDPVATELITPRDLVTHRSGLPRHDMVWYNANLSRKEIVARLPYFESSEPFRAKFQYNNIMFMTAGYLLEQLTGQSWEDAVRRRVFEPLGMTSTNFSVKDSQNASDYALPYDERDEEVRAIPFRDISNAGPAGSINSSVEDMARWVAVHTNRGKFNGKTLIGAPVLADIHAPHMTTGIPADRPEIAPAGYALGWFVDAYRGHRRVHHGGNIDGFSAQTFLLPDDGLGIVVLANKDGTGLPDLLVRHASDRLLKLDPIDWYGEGLGKYKKRKAAEKVAKTKKETVRRSGTSPGHSLEEYAGEYTHPGYGTLEIARRDGRLVLSYNGIEAPLQHWHFEVFNALKDEKDPAFEDMKAQFQTSLKGYVDGVALPFETSVKPIVFSKKPDRRLSDPVYLKRFAGEYEVAGQTYNIRVQGNALVVDAKGQPSLELLPDRDDEFNVKGITGISIRFETDKDGEVSEAAMSLPNGVFSAKRKSGGR